MPRKKKADATEEEARGPCRIPGCNQSEVIPGKGLCFIHWGADAVVNETQRMIKSKDILRQIIGTGLALASPGIQQVLTKIGTDMAAGENPIGNFRRGGASPSRPNPWKRLGLDPTKATVEDVKKVQRELSKLYHPDACGAAVSSEAMKEINAAAASCIEMLESRSSRR